MKINGWYFEEKQPDAIVAGCVAVYENMWPNPQQTIHKLNELSNAPDSDAYWSRAPTLDSGVYQNHRTNKFMPITTLADTVNLPVLYETCNTFYNILMVTTASYRRIFNINEELFAEPYSVLKYDKDTEYKVHYDGGPSSGRHVTAICYLNDDYVGGELELVNFKIKIKPQPGMMVLFPSNYAYAHIAHPIVSGTKYAVVTWMKDRI